MWYYNITIAAAKISHLCISPHVEYQNVMEKSSQQLITRALHNLCIQASQLFITVAI